MMKKFRRLPQIETKFNFQNIKILTMKIYNLSHMYKRIFNLKLLSYCHGDNFNVPKTSFLCN